MTLNAFFCRTAPAAVKRTFSRCDAYTDVVDRDYKVLAFLNGLATNKTLSSRLSTIFENMMLGSNILASYLWVWV
jgi:hypothetical protein